jgi:hypothetical protein
MAAPVWVLSVDLQTKTAAFQTGMAEAAKSARSTFQSIREAAHEGGEGVQQSAGNVRAALGLIDNTIRGNHAAAMADLVREFQNTSVVMMALPFAAWIGGIGAVAAMAVEVAEKIKEWRTEQERLNTEEMKFGTAIQQAFNTLDEKLIASGQKADELSNNHLGALKKQLELIDHQSMAELIQQFDLIAKAAEPVFKELTGHWYTIGIGSEGAAHALDQFKTKYDSLLAQGKNADASDLLKGTLKSAEGVLAAQQQLSKFGDPYSSGAKDSAITANWASVAAAAELRKAGVGYTEKELKAQEALVQALQAQVTSETKIADLKKSDSGNAAKQTGNEESARRSEGAKAAAASQLAIAEQIIQADRAFAQAQLTIKHASVQERLSSDLDFAQREYNVRVAANEQQITALDKAGKDYNNQLKALRDKALEIDQQYNTAVSEIKSRAAVEQSTRELATYEQGERDKISAQQQGSAERLAAIDSAIKDAEAKNLQETDYYRQLGASRVELVRQMAQDELKERADLSREAADHTAKMAELEYQSELQQQAVTDSARRVTAAQRLAEEIDYANREYEIKRQALESEAAALDTTGKDYTTKLQAIQDKEKQLRRAHANEVNDIQYKAVIDRNLRVKAAEQEFENSLAGGLTRSLMGYQSFAGMMVSFGQQIVGGMIQNSIAAILANDMTKPSDAAYAARQAFKAGWHFPFPANIVAAPTMAAGAFAAVMAFQEGTDGVPGVGRGDVVPAMLEPGEGVVPRGVMDGLRSVANNGGFDQKPSMQLHLNPVYNVQTIDGDGMQDALTKHADLLVDHVENALRRTNRQ